MCDQRLATQSASAKPFIEPDISISVNSAPMSPQLSRIAQASSAVTASTTVAGILQFVDRHDAHSYAFPDTLEAAAHVPRPIFA